MEKIAKKTMKRNVYTKIQQKKNKFNTKHKKNEIFTKQLST